MKQPRKVPTIFVAVTTVRRWDDIPMEYTDLVPPKLIEQYRTAEALAPGRILSRKAMKLGPRWRQELPPSVQVRQVFGDPSPEPSLS